MITDHYLYHNLYFSALAALTGAGAGVGQAGAGAGARNQNIVTSSHQTHEMTVPNEIIGCVIGKGGSKIAEIRWARFYRNFY